MRRSLAVAALALTLTGLGVAPAAAAPGPRPGTPPSPPGLDQSQVERPAQANTPSTGLQNREHSPNF